MLDFAASILIFLAEANPHSISVEQLEHSIFISILFDPLPQSQKSLSWSRH